MTYFNCPNCNAELAVTVAAVTPPPDTPPPPPPNFGTAYPLARVLPADAMYLYKMTGPYRTALKSVPGSHQLFFDILTDNRGRLWAEGMDAFKLQINSLINLTADNPELPSFSTLTYNGPLKGIYATLVARKQAGG